MRTLLPLLLALCTGALGQDWTVLELEEGRAEEGTARFLPQADGSILVDGPGDPKRYRLEFRTRQEGIRGLRIEALPDDALPKKGPGRAPNGNFVLSEVRARTVVGRSSRAVELAAASASFAQVGWPAAAAIDGREDTGWAIDGAQGKASELVVRFDEALGGGERRIALDLDFRFGQQHTIGRLRVSATSAPGPLLAAGVTEGLGELQVAINGAIDRGVQWLLAQQELDGSWEGDQDMYRAGGTALAVYALVKSGVGHDHQAVRRALAFLDANPPTKTYGAGCALLAYAAIGGDMARSRAELVLADLLDWQVGDWGYPGSHGDPTAGHRDLSNTQYGALGFWAAEKLGLHVPAIAWERLAERALRYQSGAAESGPGRGFGYGYGGNATGSMTAAGVSVLKLCEPHVGGDLQSDVRTAVARGLDWLDTMFVPTENPGAGGSWVEYYLYGVERVGAFCEREEFNRQDWYREGARALIKWQNGGGGWDRGGRPQPTTAFALLFLNRATAPSSGPGAGRRAATYGADDPAVAVNLRAAGDTPVSFWISSFGDEITNGWTFEGEEEKGPRVARVDYLTDGGVLLADSRDGGAEWRYVTKAPDEGWAQPEFEDRRWKTGRSAFGRLDSPQVSVATEWDTKEIWLRREVDLQRDLLVEPRLEVSFSAVEAGGKGPRTDLVKLYDEEASFVDVLNGGPARIEQIEGDAQSGGAFLRVTGQQRFRQAIPGWGFPLREDPEVGEFRYLQFAWRKRDGGVMVQVAIDGAWGRAQRYFAGENQVNFNPAHQVDERMPARWDVVTVDLWDDLGGDGFVTGLSLTPMAGAADFDAIYIGRSKSSLGRSGRLVDAGLEWGLAEASARPAGEEALSLWINGARVDALDHETDGFETWLEAEELLPLLKSGRNVIALHARNDDVGRALDLSIRDAQRLARVEGDRGAPSRGNRYAGRYSFPRPGQYPIRARVQLVDEASGELEVFESARLVIDVREALAPEMLDYASDASRNLVLDGLSAVSASSEVQGSSAANAVDGKQFRAWLCAPGDVTPSLRVELVRPVKADTLMLSPLRADRRVAGAAPARVEVVLNGKGDPYLLEIPASHLEKAVLRFEKSQKVRSFEVRVLDRTGDALTLPPVGFAEVELMYEGRR